MQSFANLQRQWQSESEFFRRRLNNAIAERDEARDEVCNIAARLQKLQDKIAAKGITSPRPEPNASSSTAPSGTVTPPKVQERMPSARRSSTSVSPSKETQAPPTQADQSGRQRKTPAIVPLLRLDKLQADFDSTHHQQEPLPSPSLQLRPHSGDHERLLAALQCNLGFSEDRPIAAVMVFRCCMEWDSLDSGGSPLFERIINVLEEQVDLAAGNNIRLAYLLSNSVTLLHLLMTHSGRMETARGGVERSTPRLFSPRQPSPRLVYPSVQEAKGLELLGAFRSATKGIGTFLQIQNSMRTGGVPHLPGHRAPIIYRRTSGTTLGKVRGIKKEAGIDTDTDRSPIGPAGAFTKQVEDLVQRIFKKIRDNVKDEISPHLEACVYAPRAAEESRQWNGKDGAESAAAEALLTAAWRRVVRVFDSALNALRGNHVPTLLAQKLFGQLFSFVDGRLFNELLLRGECCSFINGEYISTGLTEMDTWVESVGHTWLGICWDQLAHLRQAVDFLVNPLKHKMTLREIAEDLCPALSSAHLYRFSTLYWDGRFGTETVSKEVLAMMKKRMIEGAASPSGRIFMLGDDASIPFSTGDVAGLFSGRNLLGGVTLPETLKHEPAFRFLQKTGDLSARC